MTIIYESKNFIVEVMDFPLVDRMDGGHIRISPKKHLLDRTEMDSKLAIEFIRLTIVVGKAMKKGLINRGIKIMRINYQEMGNWAFKTGRPPYFHIHIFGRAEDAKYQLFPEAVSLPPRESGFYDEFKPLNKQDIKIIKELIESSLKTSKFSDNKWGL